MKRWPVTGLALLASVTPAQAKVVTVTVDARSGPWNVALNPKFNFGLKDGRRREAIVPIFGTVAGTRISFSATGKTSTFPDNQYFDADGSMHYDTFVERGNGTGFPSAYLVKTGRAPLNALIGAFVDSDGRIIGRPFIIGTKSDIEVPVGAMGVSMGINDDNHKDNDGTLTVTVTTVEPTVTVQ